MKKSIWYCVAICSVSIIADNFDPSMVGKFGLGAIAFFATNQSELYLRRHNFSIFYSLVALVTNHFYLPIPNQTLIWAGFYFDKYSS